MSGTKTSGAETETRTPPNEPQVETFEALIVVHCGKTFLTDPKVIAVKDLVTIPGKTLESNQRRYMFGRDELSRLTGLVDDEISSEQFCIWRRSDQHGQQVLLEDLNSKNSTYVDGERVSPHTGKRGSSAQGARCAEAELRDGAVLRASNTVMVYRKNFAGSKVPDAPFFSGIVSPFGLRPVKARIDAMCRLLGNQGQFNILLEAETGSGKELLAGYVASKIRPGRKFYASNTALLGKELFVATFFGARKGSHSTAHKDMPGVVVEANGGSLFLDEIDKAQDPSVYSQLLRFLETRDYIWMGGTKAEKADVLVITSTSSALEDKITRDLFERLREHHVRLAPLRERTEDLAALCQALLARLTGWKQGAPVSAEVLEYLMLQEWPGNVRALRNTLSAMLTASEVRGNLGLHMQDIRSEQAQGGLPAPPLLWSPVGGSQGTARGYPSTWTFRSLTRERVRKALELVAAESKPGKQGAKSEAESKPGKQGAKSEAARRLGITDDRLNRWLE